MTRWAQVTLTITILLCVALGNPVPLHAAGGPSITSLTPSTGAVGASVTIAGSGFGSTQGTSTVKFNGTTATTISSWSASSIVAIVPTGATTGTVVVTVSAKASNGVTFTVVPAPSITSLSPTSGAVASSVTISGTNFTTAQGTVTFNGTSASITSWNATTIVAVVPAGATTGNVVVHASGVNSNGVSFTVLPGITSLSPTSGAIGALVTITGTSFGATQGSSTVTFNGTTASPTSWSATSIVAPVPAGATTGSVVVTVGGSASSGVSFTVVPAPSITSLSPSSGTVGTSITINGNNFGSTQSGSTVAFNGTAATPTSWSATSIVVPVPAGANSGNVVVQVGGVASNGVSFTVIASPNITSLSPPSGAPGISVTVNGTYFGTTQGSSTVMFNGIAATATSWSATSIVATVPADATTGSVTVTVNGLTSNSVTFTVLPQPTITTISPQSGTTGTLVSVSGSGFGAVQGTSTITFNGTIASPGTWSATAIVVNVPATANTGNVVVTVGGQASNGVTFTVTNPGPVISSVSPTSGNAGTSVTISGSNFGATQGTSTLTFNGTAATPTSWSASSIVAPVPSGATTGYVIATVNGVASNGVCFALSSSAPCITRLSPVTGSAGTPVTVTGINFGSSQGSSTLTFNGTAATATSWSATSIATTVPAGAISGNVVVKVSRTSSPGVYFTVPAPSVASLFPATGRTGTSITITGSNFGTTKGTSTVTFNGISATPTSWSVSQIVVPVPTGATSGPVIVTVGGVASAGVNFTVSGPPTISGISPTTGPINTVVTVTGSGFGSPQGTSVVKFNTTSGTPISWSDTSILVPVPAGATTGSVVVTTGGTNSNGVTFTVSGGPTITTLSPTSGSAGTPVTVSGSNFGATQGTSVVRFNGVAAAVTSWTATAIGVTVPAGVSTGPVTATVNGQTSNGVPFTAVTTGALSGTVSAASGGAAISGATVQALQNGTVKGSATSAGNGTYTISSLATGNYDVQASATSFGTGLKNSISIAGGQTATANFSLSTPGTVSGTVTQADGVTAISGATVKILVGSAAGSNATTDGSGNYSIGGLNAASYTVQVSATGFVTQSKSIAVSAGGTTTSNFSLQNTGVNPITYVYDELGRLISVIDSSGDAATYQYDAVGNILSISRQSSAAILIVSFTPKTGPSGTSVTINGTGFSTTASQDTVQFNGVSATVTSATATQIVTSVPSTATTGPITVTSPAGSATSAANFTVGTSAGTPTITSFTPAVATSGTAVAITGTNFDTSIANDKIVFNITHAVGTSATATQINTNVPSNTTSGHLSLTTPSGKATSSQDFFVPFGSHVAADVGYTGRVAEGGTQTVSLPTASQIGLLLFDSPGSEGISLQLSGSTFATCTIYLYAPNGTLLSSSDCTSATTLGPAATLSTAGTYTIGVDPLGATGSLTISLTPDVSETITVPPIGQTGPAVRVPATGNLLPNQNANLTFSATSGQRLSFNVLNPTIGVNYYDCYLTLKDPLGNSVASGYCGVGASNFIDVVTLTSTGTYSIFIDPQGAATGSVSVSINNVSDATGAITIDGAAVTATTTVSGQDARLNFTATAGQRIVAYATNVTQAYATLYLVKPDGTTQTNIGINNNPAGQTFFIDTQTLATAGTYQLWIQHSGTNFGSETLQIASVPADFTSPITVPPAGQTGAAVRVPATGNLAIGQNSSLTFSGTSGQRLSFNVLTPNIGTVYYGCYTRVYDPSNNQIAFSYCGPGATNYIDTVTLAATGTYSIFTDPQGTATGSVSYSINNGSDVTGTITIDGAAVPVTTAVAGQDARLSFTATAGQRIVAYATSVTNPSATVYLVKPDGTNQVTLGINNNPAGQTFFMDTQTLATTGTYQLWVQHSGTNIGSETLQIASVPADFTSTITVPAAGQTGTAVRVPTSGNLAVGQNGTLTFSGTTGQKLSFNVLSPAIGTVYYGCYTRVYDPSNNQVAFGYCGPGASNYIDTITLAATGTYSILTDPQGSATGSVSYSINNGSDVTGTIAIDGSPVTVTTTVSGEDARLSFSATAGQRIVAYVTSVTNPSATVSLVKPDGTNQVGFGINNNPAGQTFFMDTQVLATTGTYQLWVQHSGTNVGSETLQIASVPADFNSTITVPAAGQAGTAVRVPTSGSLAVGQNGKLTFSGTTGQKLSFNVLNPNIGTVYYGCYTRVYDPSNNQVAFGYCGPGASSYIDTITLAATGTYSILTDPQGSATGSVSYSINNGSDVTGTITIDGSPVAVTTTVSGQDARLSFSATAGQRIVAYVTSVTNPSATVYLVKPDGTNQVSFGINNNPAGQTFYMDTQTLATTGTYQLWVQHSSTNIGSETLQIASVPADFTSTITVPAAGQTGAAVRVPTSGNLAVGQNGTLTFSGTTGQKLSFNVLSPNIGTVYYGCYTRIYDPSNNQVGFGYCGPGASNYIDTITLAATGTYSILTDPQGTGTGSVSYSINNDSDVTGSIAIDGSAVTVTTTVSGEDARLTFSATAGQRIVVYATNVTSASATVNLVKPDGTNLTSFSINNNPAGQTFFLDTQTLATTGTYQLWIQHSGTNVGSETLQIASVPADISGSVTIGGSAFAFSTVAGQNANITFSNSLSQSVTVHWTSGTYPSSLNCYMRVTGPSPSTTQVGFAYCNTATGTLSMGTLAAGSYNILVDPQTQSTGGLSLTVTTP